MKILITSGGTSEAIDGVRKITNMSTGKLGAQIANRIVDFIDDVEIYFLSDIKLALPEFNHKIKIIPITDTNSVLENMTNIIECNKIDYVIHAMAISDYTTEKVFNVDALKEAIAISKSYNYYFRDDEVNCIIDNINWFDCSKKISSKDDTMFIQLKKTPKIVDKIKEWDPDIKLISFKLLNCVSEDELIEVGTKQLMRTRSDLVIANDLTNIKNGNHRALFIKENGYKIVESKEQIANEICSYIINNSNSCK